MKKVLIITHLLQASPRIPGLAKYLTEFGWEPILITAPYPERYEFVGRVIETLHREPLSFWKRLFGFKTDDNIREVLEDKIGIDSDNAFASFLFTKCGEIFNYPDHDKCWRNFAINAAEELLRSENIDVILSSSSPVTSHIVAREVKLRHKIPWVADLRDLWTQNHNYHYGNLRKMIDRRLELKILSTADVLVTTSKPWALELGSFHHKERFTYAITNGFDPNEISNDKVTLTSKFSITYTGSIYRGKQDLTGFFSALRDLIFEESIDNKEIEVRFYGHEEKWLAEEIKEYGLADIVKQYGKVSQRASLDKQKESQLLLLLDWNDQKTNGCYPLKIFEYLVAQRPIFVSGLMRNTVVRQLVESTQSGFYASRTEEIKPILRKLYMEYKENGRINYHGETAKINRYSYREMAKKFAGILESLNHN
ncbi:hypothetical protein D4R78_01965 [bacterium]|nr:MAG: hypothetical protein D4R78_01965 [bacterium]